MHPSCGDRAVVRWIAWESYVVCLQEGNPCQSNCFARSCLFREFPFVDKKKYHK